MFSYQEKRSFPDLEERVLRYWQKFRVFERSLENRQDCPCFSVYDGPPFATGLPHYGHILAGTIKDVIPRYKSMQGYYVPRVFGWDCHGLPIENEIEKTYQLHTTDEVESFGIAAFNKVCRDIVLRYTSEWESIVARMGRWVQFENSYKTMNQSFMESVWWVFAALYKKGLVYEGIKVMPFSTKLGTTLANFEANLNYQTVDDPSLVVAFPLIHNPNQAFLAWTTTPWTLPSNMALALHPEESYAVVRHPEHTREYILAASQVREFFDEQAKIVEIFPGKTLQGTRYLPPFSYFSAEEEKGAFQVLCDDQVDMEEGCGIIHMAPAFGELDFSVCMEHQIPVVCPVDRNGKFTQEISDFVGQYIKDKETEKALIKKLKNKGLLFQQGVVRHRYPFCWRSDTPLIYRSVQTWFVAVEKIKDALIENNQKIHWVPGHIKDGRFGKWLENARDWAVSRSRYWGTPIPIWQSEDGDIIVISSLSELEQKSGVRILDMHRDHVDAVTFIEGGKKFSRIPEVFDCWFESGSMPYAQHHYPFENQEKTMSAFPADFVAEGLDQTRGWFYTLNVLSTALFDSPAFKNVIVNGIVLAENGSKMSKRLQNYPDPLKVVQDYGADAVRLFLLQSGAVHGEDLRFAETGVELVLRQVMIPLWNSYVFLATYAKLYQWDPETCVDVQLQDIDSWLLSLLGQLVEDVTEAMESYQLTAAVGPLINFVDQLTNWYIRRSRNRFWSEEDTPTRRAAFFVLYKSLLTFVKVSAPFIPFISDTIYLELVAEKEGDSVHLQDFPKKEHFPRDYSLEKEMSLVQKVVSAGHALRKDHKLKVRQPLSQVSLVVGDGGKRSLLVRQKSLIQEELNVKDVVFENNESEFVFFSCKPKFRELGKKYGSRMREIQEIVKRWGAVEAQLILSGQSITILQESGQPITLLPEEVEIQRSLGEGVVGEIVDNIVILFDVTLTESLIVEGFARELVNKVNTMRRTAQYHVSDIVQVNIETSQRVKDAFVQHEKYICQETMSDRWIFQSVPIGEEWDINGELAKLSLELSKE